MFSFSLLVPGLGDGHKQAKLQGEELDEASICERFRKGLSVLHGGIEIMRMFAENGEFSRGARDLRMGGSVQELRGHPACSSDNPGSYVISKTFDPRGRESKFY